MKLKIILNIFFVLFTIMPATSTLGRDTGTYEIEDYSVTLTPLKNGSTVINYYQKWKVTGGNIQWITVGLPNTRFYIIDRNTGKNISYIRPNNSGSWYGVYITLDKNYRAGETFEVAFAVVQNDLLYSYKENYRLYFIPGWYDRGRINHLAVRLNFFTKLEGVKARPTPENIQDQSLTWERQGLKNGSRFPVYIDFPKNLFPENVQPGTGKKIITDIPPAVWVFIFIIVLLCIVFFAAVLSGRKNKYGSGGRIRTGGAAIGVHRPGCVVSCACACVSCACACACAGGGAAGCDRKLTLTCPLCKECKLDDCPVRNEKGTMQKSYEQS